MMKATNKYTSDNTQWLIFTDLDGSLLDHHTYSHLAAEKLLAKLEHLQIPVIFTSSKTRAEIKVLKNTIGNIHPFISENGNGIYIPINYFPYQPKNTYIRDNFWVYSLSKPREYWLSILREAEQPFKNKFTYFSALSNKEISDITGLGIDKAQLANQREYGEPVVWLSDSESKKEFVNWLTTHNATVLQGGRFLHVSGLSDKGQAMRWLKKSYQRYSDQKPVTTLALGDSNNDIAMLEQAERAVVIRNEASTAFKLERKEFTFKTTKSGSEGWVEGVEHFLTFL